MPETDAITEPSLKFLAMAEAIVEEVMFSKFLVLTVEEKGVPVQAREALAFALLAWWHSVKHEGNSPAVTGALRSLVLGVRVDPG